MKKISIFLLIILTPSIFLFFSGCEELDEMIDSATKPNYINVIVNADATVFYKYTFYAKDGTSASTDMWMNSTTVRFDMIKDYGETHTFYKVTDYAGKTSTATASFKLYKEQPIESIAYVEGMEKDLYPPSKKTLTWDEVNKTKDFGETYTWNVRHDIVGHRMEYET
jgi:hypothetical protein